MTGVFDPPPETLSVPWVYLTLLVVAAVASTGAALVGAQLVSARSKIEDLRDI